MGVERLPVTEIVLDEIRHRNDQLMSWMVIGFTIGFILGALLAVSLVTLR